MKSRNLNFLEPFKPYHLPVPLSRNLGTLTSWNLLNLTIFLFRCLEIWEPQPPGTLRACPDNQRRGEEVYFHSVSTSALDGCERSCDARAGKNLSAHWNVGWLDPRAGLRFPTDIGTLILPARFVVTTATALFGVFWFEFRLIASFLG